MSETDPQPTDLGLSEHDLLMLKGEEKTEAEDNFSKLDRLLYAPDYNYFSSNIVEAKDECFDLMDQSPNSDFWYGMLQLVEEQIEFNEEEPWDEIMSSIYPLIHDVLRQTYRGMAFMRDNEVRIIEFVHRYAVYSFLESSKDEAKRSDRMEDLLGTTQRIFYSGHREAEQLNDNRAIIDYQTGYESYLSVLTACRNPEEIKNSVFALLEASSGVDWEAEKENQSILGARARYQMEKGDFLFDDDYQSENAYVETVQIALSALIRSGAKLSNEEAIFLLNIAISSTEKHYLPHITELLSSNTEPAIQGLLKIMQNKDAHEVQRHIALSVLYRLELGRIGISDEGVEYLSRKFDLGEHNKSDNSVQRITADGKLGVFDDKDSLLGFFQLESGDFSGNQTIIQKKLQEITIDILFTPQVDESKEERESKMKMIEEFKNNYLDSYRKLFPEGDGQIPFHFNNLSLPEQGFALKFLNQHEEGDPSREKFFNFIEKFGENGFKAFRSIEFDPDAGERLFALESEMSHDQLELLLSEYAKMYQTAEEVAQWIRRALTSIENNDSQDLLETNIIREQILRAAQSALINPVPSGVSRRIIFNHLTANLGGLEGSVRLHLMQSELKKVLNFEPNPDNFTQLEVNWGKYLADSNISGDKLSLSEQDISNRLAKLYDNQEFSLRDYEGKTSDTSRSLGALLQAIEDMPPQEATGDPDQCLIYDIGAGDGRIAIPLALDGNKVVGIDYSERMVADSKTRPLQFAEAYRRRKTDHLLDSTKKVFGESGREIDDEAVDEMSQNIDIEYGNFFDFDANKFHQNFGERQPDVAIIMWHTLGFAGDLPRMQQVLSNVYNILRPGGRIIIEMPDRNFGGYARAIRDFHQSHPEQPFGVIEDAPSKSADSPTEQNKNLATWRYFPKNSEIEDVLRQAGFDIGVSGGESYFVKAEAGPNAKLLVKENMFIAEKPLDQARLQKITEYAKSEVNNDQDTI